MKCFCDVGGENNEGFRGLHSTCAFRLSPCRYVGMAMISIADFGGEGAELQGP